MPTNVNSVISPHRNLVVFHLIDQESMVVNILINMVKNAKTYNAKFTSFYMILVIQTSQKKQKGTNVNTVFFQRIIRMVQRFTQG